MATPVHTFTAEQTAAGLAKTAEGRRLKAEYAAAHLRKDFLDSPEWDRLAALYGVRLPSWVEPCRVPVMRRWLGKLGLNPRDYPGLADFPRMNPAWPLRSFVGLMLEEKDRRATREASRQREEVT